MAIINSIVMGKARGSIGNATLAIVGGDTIARQKISKGTGGGVVRSFRQMARRVQWGNLVNIWQLFNGNDRPSFQTRNARVSDFNAFVQANLASGIGDGGVAVFLNKAEARQGAAVAAPYKVTEGDMPSIDNAVSGTNGEISTDISLGSLTISESTTLAQFSRAIIDNNAGRFANGDQITVFVATQESNSVTGLPYVSMKTAKIKLNVSDNETLLEEFDPDGLYFAVTPGTDKLGMSAAVNGAVVYIHSRKEQGVVRVSSQRFIATNTLLVNYESNAKRDNAIISYGGKLTGYYLDPDTAAIQTV